MRQQRPGEAAVLEAPQLGGQCVRHTMGPTTDHRGTICEETWKQPLRALAACLDTLNPLRPHFPSTLIFTVPTIHAQLLVMKWTAPCFWIKNIVLVVVLLIILLTLSNHNQDTNYVNQTKFPENKLHWFWLLGFCFLLLSLFLWLSFLNLCTVPDSRGKKCNRGLQKGIWDRSLRVTNKIHGLSYSYSIHCSDSGLRHRFIPVEYTLAYLLPYTGL